MRVHSYQFGSSQAFGQSPAYFPYNVLGAICTTATPTNPCADPCQVVSLGKGGFIVLEFDPPIADGHGVDFIVFENAFRYGNGQVFDEWMIVSVSQDGILWQTFPYDSITGEGLAGRTPTGCTGCSGPIDWQDPSQAGGDAFDLATVGLSWARYVRVTDATHWQPSNRLSADLDGVVAIHQLHSAGLLALSSGFLLTSQAPPVVRAWSFSGQEVEVELIRLDDDKWTIRIAIPAVVQIQTDKGAYLHKVLVPHPGTLMAW
ncbi:MAG: hypothetical protein ABDH66_04110 [Bacteroidia bacterium]